jgi:hypothetical protein
MPSKPATRKRPDTQPEKREMASANTLTNEPPSWVKSAQEHFHRTGSYRPEDLIRLIGDPRDSVEVTLSSEADLACRILK